MIGFIDTEVGNNTKKVHDIGCFKENGDSIHTQSVKDFVRFAKNVDIFCGHNIVSHDVKYLRPVCPRNFIREWDCIDTLYISVLLFPENPYHKLVKDDKRDSDAINNPLNDAINAKKLFEDEVVAFRSLDRDLQDIYFSLLWNVDGFSAFFRHLRFSRKLKNVDEIILTRFDKMMCENANLVSLIQNFPVELAYCLALIQTKRHDSLMPPWVLVNHPHIEEIMLLLRSTPCKQGCEYCRTKLNAPKALKQYFGYDRFRDFEGVPLQENAVNAALQNKSLIAVFPTGGGKSLTYQLPALMSRENARGLTVVISPLQSLMKDQVDNLEKKNIITSVTINGLLSPVERSQAIERVGDGSAGILYIAPESLRSRTIERLLTGRHVVRFVIDEAHCFSSWGHDFRVDYLYIGDFIKNIQERKGHENPIPVSCFTATAKKNVIQDIQEYFRVKLGIEMLLFQTGGRRTNLHYKVYDAPTDEQKYTLLRNLIDQEACPTIVYASRRKQVEEIYEHLSWDQYSVSMFHGGMDTDEKVKQQNQFMSGQTSIMVATSAFGMGVDKDDVGCVIHYSISDSLENYVQESGRAGRKVEMNANCYILYSEDDLDRHFELLNRGKLNLKEIQQVWKAIKDVTKTRENISQSALEIARVAGWDENLYDLQTRITTAIAALEDSGYLKRGQNAPRIYANSILVNSLIDASKIIDACGLFDETQKGYAKRIFGKLISSKNSKIASDEDAESRVDYISDHLGIPKEDVINILNVFREINILADAKDLVAFIRQSSRTNTSLKILRNATELMSFIYHLIRPETQKYHLKEMNELLIEQGHESNLQMIKTLVNYMAIKNVFEMKKLDREILILNLAKKEDEFTHWLEKLSRLSESILTFLFDRVSSNHNDAIEYIEVQFSVLELQKYYESTKSMFDDFSTPKEIEDALYFLQKISALKIEGGFMVIYNPMKIERIEKDNRKLYTKADYHKLETFYKGKMQQIHIVGEYATKMVEDYQKALLFVDDYFKMEYKDFLNKYFTGKRKRDIEINLSQSKFKQLFGALSPEQTSIVMEKDNSRVIVAAGPGSGKTRLLVHKLASILYTEDIRQEQLLMLTFSRSSVTEFKERLTKLIGTAANYIDIKTFHSYAFDILGRMGSLEKTDVIIRQATEKIEQGEIDPNKITKMVLVIDEAQDINEDEYHLLQALIAHNENLRIIAVGDDDQNIFEFRGSSSRYLVQLSESQESVFELSTNYRSQKNIVEYANKFVERIPNRIKKIPIRSHSDANGVITSIKHASEDLVIPVVQHVLAEELQGTTCVLTRTNEQALAVAGLLNKHHVQAHLIQNNDGFRLTNIQEIITFLNIIRQEDHLTVISDKTWDDALQILSDKYKDSSNISLVFTILKAFRDSCDRTIYISDLYDFLIESELSDFMNNYRVSVSTFHKAKGKEFDHVFLLYDNAQYIDDAEKRLLYVGMTRAKKSLHIHYRNAFFDSLQTETMKYQYDPVLYEEPDRMAFQLSHRDVNLGFFKYIQKNLEGIMSGMNLDILDQEFLTYCGRKVLRFSKNYVASIQNLYDNGYKLTEAKVRFVLSWKSIEEPLETWIILPDLVFDKIEVSSNEYEHDIPSGEESGTVETQ